MYLEINETTNQWGRKRRDFYGTSYVDQDFGGIHDSEEEEFLDMEEKDAIKRQKKQDSALDYVNFNDFDDEKSDASNDSLNLHVERNDLVDQVSKKSKLKFKRKTESAVESNKVCF